MKILALKAVLAAFLLTGANVSGQTINITVPNADFSDSSNYGTQEGGLLGVLGSYDRRIDYVSILNQGNGVWRGQGAGALGILLPPTTSITADTQKGVISGIGVNVANLVATSASIYQPDIGTNYTANTLYTLTADIDLGTVLSLDVINNPGFGIGLLANGSVLAASTSAAPGNVSLGLLSGTTYQLTLSHAIYTGNPAVGGDIGIQLYQNPGGLLGVGVTQVAFDNITLTATAVPEPGSLLFVTLGSVLLLRRQRRRA